MVQDVKIRGDRYSPVLREKKKAFQLPKDLREKVFSPDPEMEEKRTPKYSKAGQSQ